MNNNQTESKNHSPHFLRKRKMMLVYPILVLPFLTMVFWALGGGSGDKLQQPVSASGLNLALPTAHLKEDNSENKLSYYQQAEKDSVKTGSSNRNDLFFRSQEPNDSSAYRRTQNRSSLSNDPLIAENDKDPNEEKVYKKLAELNQQLNMPSDRSSKSPAGSPVDKTTSTENNNEVEKLDRLMKNINKSDTAQDDPEMKNLNGMMDKILDIQHPERVQERQEQSSKKTENIYPINNEPTLSSVGLLDTFVKKQDDVNGFFGLETESSNQDQNATEAVVHENQTLVNGAVIKLRLLNDISVNGNIIHKDNFIFGNVSLNGERLQVEVSSIKSGNSLFPVKLSVYDMDGLPGIYIPGAITRDVAKESIDNATQMMQLSSLDPSVKAQATTAGIDAVKSLLSKKVKLVSVTVKAGYKVLLK